jgi:hypothetical protein
MAIIGARAKARGLTPDELDAAAALRDAIKSR